MSKQGYEDQMEQLYSALRWTVSRLVRFNKISYREFTFLYLNNASEFQKTIKHVSNQCEGVLIWLKSFGQNSIGSLRKGEGSNFKIFITNTLLW